MTQGNPAPATAPLDKNKANGAASGTLGVGAIGTGITIEVLGQLVPHFTLGAYETMGVTLAWAVIGAWLGAYLAKHDISIPGQS